MTKHAFGQVPESPFSVPHFHFLSISTLTLAFDLNFSSSSPSKSKPSLFLSFIALSTVWCAIEHRITQSIYCFCCLFHHVINKTRQIRKCSSLDFYQSKSLTSSHLATSSNITIISLLCDSVTSRFKFCSTSVKWRRRKGQRPSHWY